MSARAAMDSPEGTLKSLVELAQAGVPVLRATVAELKRMECDPERVSVAVLTTAILRDPLMTLRVLRFLHSHRTRSQTADITTIGHAIMMLGQARFFREFSALPSVEEALTTAPETLTRVRAAMSRARLASLFARDWAVQRHDMDPDEVMVAALVYDITELLFWLQCPDAAPVLTTDEQAGTRARLFAQLGLPGLLAELTALAEPVELTELIESTEEKPTHRPRVLNVRLACVLARHCAEGWQHPLLGEDLEHIQRLLHISAVEVWDRIRRVALQAAREWRIYQVRPAAAYLPLYSVSA